MPSGHEPGFVGRERELQLLSEALAETQGGRGRLVALIGDAGIGKTRTIEELATRAAIGPAQMLWGRCPEQAGAPAYWPWVRVIRAWAATRDDEELRTGLAGDAALIAQLVPDLRTRLPAELPVAPPVGETRFLLWESVAAWLHRASLRAPLVLVFDDLHWVDEASLALLAFVARELRGMRLLVIGSLRRGRDARRAPRGLSELMRAAQTVPMTGLDRPATEMLIANVTGTPPAPALLTELHETSEGNPFFLAGLVRGLKTSASLDASESLPLPEDVRESIRRQLEPLAGEEYELLALAAVIGRDFELGLLQVSSGAAAASVLAAVTAAVAASLVVEDGAADRFRFAHALIRETLYADLLPAARAEAHRRVARALESVHGNAADQPLAQLAMHFFHAAALGEGERAFAYAMRAGADATQRFAYDEAVGHYERALRSLSLIPLDEPRRLDVLLALGDAARRAGDTVKARATYQRTANAARSLGDSARLARAALGSYRAAGRYGAHPEVVRLLDEALAMLGDAMPALRIELLAALAIELHFAPNDGRCAEISAAAVAAARGVGSPRALIPALMAQHLTLLSAADLPARLAVTAELLHLTTERDADPRHTLLVRICHLIDLLERGDILDAEIEIAQYAQDTEVNRLPHLRWHAQVLSGNLALLRGRFEEAERLAAEALASRRDGQDRGATAVFFLQTFDRRREVGHLADLVPRNEALVREEPHARPWRCMLAMLHAELGRTAEARAGFEELAGDDFGDLPRDAHYPALLAMLAELASYLGDAARAELLYRLLLPYDGRNVVVHTYTAVSHGAVARFLGLLATTVGRIDAAARHFGDALTLNAKMGARAPLAHTHHDFARSLLARGAVGDADRASELLAEAWRMAEALGMRVLLDRISALRTADASAPQAANPSKPLTASLRRNGDTWGVRYGDESLHLKDTKGVGYLHLLLRHPGEEFHVLDLASPQSGTEPRAHGGDAGELLDPAARAAYKRRLVDLRDEHEEALRFNDPDRAAHAASEIDFLTDELARAVGLGGRSRKAASDAERARVNLTRTIGAVVKKIAGECPALGQLLTASVRTGIFCSYNPDPRLRIVWDLE